MRIHKLLLILVAATALLAGTTPRSGVAAPAKPEVEQGLVITGQPAPGLFDFDGVMALALLQHRVPGGELAVAKDGRLVLNHGFGFADVDAQEPVLPPSRFRIAGVSKAITAVAVLTLVDQGRLSLDDKPLQMLNRLQPPAGASVDPRLYDITVRDLLQNKGGWDSSRSGDPLFPPRLTDIANALGVPLPPSPADIIGYMLGQPLDFAPGSRTADSNFGYNVLARVIETVSGMDYEQYVQAQVLIPAGISDMRLGRTRAEDRAPDEVHYYAPGAQDSVPSVFAEQGLVPQPYGSFSMEAIDACCGWIGTASDVVRFATAIDGQRGTALLRPETASLILNASGGRDWEQAGSLAGSSAAWLVRTRDGVTIAFVANSLPKDADAFFLDSTTLLEQIAANVTTWPDGDQFGAP